MNNNHFITNVHFQDESNQVRIRVYALVDIDSNTLEYISANTPQSITSFSGSALPFKDEAQAYENTPNTGSIRLIKKKGDIVVQYPNAYYKEFGNIYVKPHVTLIYSTKGVRHAHNVMIADSVSSRSLTYPLGRTTPMFYQHDDVVTTQEARLRSNAYSTVFS
jgi:hypothetical protein